MVNFSSLCNPQRGEKHLKPNNRKIRAVKKKGGGLGFGPFFSRFNNRGFGGGAIGDGSVCDRREETIVQTAENLCLN